MDAKVTDKMTPEMIEQMREEAGLNDPLPVQYLRWLKNLLKGDLGQSLINRTNIATDLKEKIPNTIKLVLPSYVTAFLHWSGGTYLLCGAAVYLFFRTEAGPVPGHGHAQPWRGFL